MFEDYREKVKAAYDAKKEAHAISMNLMRPSPAKLKAECAYVYQNRYLRKDDKAISTFFLLVIDNGNDYGPIIKNFDVDKFRPLINFLIGRTSYTDDKNVELLAWLIDFEQRPYAVFEKNNKEDQDNSTLVNLIRHKTSNQAIVMEDELPLATDSKPEISDKKNIIKMSIFSMAVILTAIGIAYMRTGTEPRQQCMYWTGDHYQVISCNKKIDDKPIMALDSTKLEGLKRITKPDTLTAGSLGKVWYTKVDGELQFFTAAGYHPLDDNKRLLPLTVYILNNHPLRK